MWLLRPLKIQSSLGPHPMFTWHSVSLYLHLLGNSSSCTTQKLHIALPLARHFLALSLEVTSSGKHPWLPSSPTSPLPLAGLLGASSGYLAPWTSSYTELQFPVYCTCLPLGQEFVRSGTLLSCSLLFPQCLTDNTCLITVCWMN